jgi:predicted nucleic acid-binding protein
VLSLALQEKANFVILDDRKAFNEARELHLAVISTRTVLTFAEERHLVQDYREIEEELRANQLHPPKY